MLPVLRARRADEDLIEIWSWIAADSPPLPTVCSTQSRRAGRSLPAIRNLAWPATTLRRASGCWLPGNI